MPLIPFLSAHVCVCCESTYIERGMGKGRTVNKIFTLARGWERLWPLHMIRKKRGGRGGTISK